MIDALLVLGVSLIVASFLLNHTQAPQRQLIRIEKETERRRSRR